MTYLTFLEWQNSRSGRRRAGVRRAGRIRRESGDLSDLYLLCYSSGFNSISDEFLVTGVAFRFLVGPDSRTPDPSDTDRQNGVRSDAV